MYARPRRTSTANAVADYDNGEIIIHAGNTITSITSTHRDEESEGGRWKRADPSKDTMYRGHNAANDTSGTFPKEVVGELQLISFPEWRAPLRFR